jgi:Zn-dependent protease
MEFGLDFFTISIAVLTIIVAISLHEMMHAFVGLKLGDTTAHDEGRVSINPLRHIDPFMTILLPIITLISFGAPILAAKPVPFNPDRVKFDEFGAALIAAAGPLTNLVLAVIGALLVRLFVTEPGDLFNALSIFVGINIGIFVFNLVPIPPLDGSRVLYAFAPDFLRDIMAQMEQFGIFIVFGLVLLVPGFSQVISNLVQSIALFLL